MLMVQGNRLYSLLIQLKLHLKQVKLPSGGIMKIPKNKVSQTGIHIALIIDTYLAIHLSKKLPVVDLHRLDDSSY